MTAGVFKRFDHDHCFEFDGEFTRVRDSFDFKSPCGPIGVTANWLFVTRHLRRFLERRMQAIKSIAESDDWMIYLEPS